LFTNEILGEADPLLTILFTGLWCLADKAGRLEDRPKRIKAEIFPYRELTGFNGYLTDLERLGFIERYSVENQPIIQVLSFTKHQSPHKTEKPSELGAKPATTGVTVKAPLNNESLTEEAALIPDYLIPDSLLKPTAHIGTDAGHEPESKNFKPPTLDDVRGAVMLAGLDVDPELFFHHFQSTGWQINGNPMNNWQARLQVWARDEAKRNQQKHKQSTGDTTRKTTLQDDLTDTSWATGS